MKEIWKDIPNWEGFYKASDWGRIKSTNRVVYECTGKKKNLRGIILKQGMVSGCYLNVVLYKNGKGKTKNIHILVAITFLGHVPCGHKEVINHIDGNKLNNNVSNLEITTQRDNTSGWRNKTKTSSKYVGVYWNKPNNKWLVSIRIKRNHIHLGYFTDEGLAKLSYDNALKNIDKYNDNPKEFRGYIKNLINIL